MPGNTVTGRYSDTCFAWVIVLASFVVSFGLAANGVVMSVLLDPFLVYFQETQAMLGILGAVRLFTFHGSGLLAGSLVQRFGPRPVAAFGILLCAAGTITASFTTKFYQMIITFCVLAGTGAGFLFIPSSVIVHHYHNKNRALAASIASAGLSMASSSFPPLFRLAMNTFGWRVSLAILASVTIQCLVGAMLFMPNPSTNGREPNLKKDGYQDDHDEENAEAIAAAHVSEMFESSLSVPTKKSSLCEGLKIFTNKFFVLFILAILPFQCGISCFMYLCVQRAIDRDILPMKAAFMPTAFGIGSFVGRFVSGFIGNSRHINRIVLMSVCIMLDAAVLASSIICKDRIITHLAFALGFGLCFGMTMGVFSTVQVDLVGLKMLPTAMSISQFSRAVASLSILPIAGWLVDLTGDYTASFLLCGSFQMLGGVIILIVGILKRRQENTKIPRTA